MIEARVEVLFIMIFENVKICLLLISIVSISKSKLKSMFGEHISHQLWIFSVSFLTRLFLQRKIIKTKSLPCDVRTDRMWGFVYCLRESNKSNFGEIVF